MYCGEQNWPDSIPNFNGVLTLEMTLERFEGRNTLTQSVKCVVTTLDFCFIDNNLELPLSTLVIIVLL
jgi:hypothetical protein